MLIEILKEFFKSCHELQLSMQIVSMNWIQLMVTAGV